MGISIVSIVVGGIKWGVYALKAYSIRSAVFGTVKWTVAMAALA